MRRTMLWVIVFVVVMIVAIYATANRGPRRRGVGSNSGTTSSGWGTPVFMDSGDSGSHHHDGGSFGSDGGASGGSDGGASGGGDGGGGGSSCGGGGGCGGGGS